MGKKGGEGRKEERNKEERINLREEWKRVVENEIKGENWEKEIMRRRNEKRVNIRIKKISEDKTLWRHLPQSWQKKKKKTVATVSIKIVFITMCRLGEYFCL